MKRVLTVIFALILGIIGSNDPAVSADTTLMGPQLYVRNSGAPDIFNATFRALPGRGTIIVKNGRSDGNKRIEDSISSASVRVNDAMLFGPSDFDKNTYLLSSTLDLSNENSLAITLAIPGDCAFTVAIRFLLSCVCLTIE